ncbi:hypothetical protein Tco_0414457 [Tanacetum coccineum]
MSPMKHCSKGCYKRFKVEAVRDKGEELFLDFCMGVGGERFIEQSDTMVCYGVQQLAESKVYVVYVWKKQLFELRNHSSLEGMRKCLGEIVLRSFVARGPAKRSMAWEPGDVAVNCRGTAGKERPQADARIDAEVEEMLDETPRKRSNRLILWKLVNTWKDVTQFGFVLTYECKQLLKRKQGTSIAVIDFHSIRDHLESSQNRECL